MLKKDTKRGHHWFDAVSMRWK